MVAASPSLPGVVLPGSVASTAAAVATVLAAIPVVMAEAASEVSLAAPPPPAAAEEERETGLPALPGGGLHDSPSRSALVVLGGDVAGMEPERPSVARETEVVEITFDDEADDEVEPPMLLWEMVVVRSGAGPFSGLKETDLEWPCPEDPTKVWFVLRDSQECQLWDILGGRGLAMESDLVDLSVKLGEG